MRFTTRNISLVGVFAALHVILYFMSFGLWRNWAVYLEPLEGIILGPYAGFLAALIGSTVARWVKPIDVWMFGIIAEPLGVLASGFLAGGRWKPVALIYVVMLAAYFLHPFGRWLPFWAILDILLAFILIYPVAKISKNVFVGGRNVRRLPLSLVLISFVGTVTDALTRVFLLVPAELYRIIPYIPGPEALYGFFVFGAIDSYMEDGLVVIVSFLVGVPLLVALRKLPGFKYPVT